MSQYTNNLIPIMTSNTSNGIASASSTMSGYNAYKAFDGTEGSDSSCWISNNSQTGWIEYDFTSPKIISKYTLTHWYTTITWSPKNWTFQGSNDGTNWITLDTQTNITNWSMGVIKEFTFINLNAYTKYRLNITANNGHPYVAIYEFQMMSIIPNYFLIKQNSNYYTIKSTNYDSITSHNFISLSLTGGSSPNKSDIETFGFSDLNVLTNNMTVNTDTFKPIDKFDNTAELKMYKG